MKPGDYWEAKECRRQGDASRSDAPPAPVPCLNSHNSNDHLSGEGVETDAEALKRLLAQARKLGGSAAKTAFALRENIMGFILRVGLHRCAFVTLTFGGGGEGPSCAGATRKFNTFLTGWMRNRWPGGFRILERGEKKGRVHFHLLVDTGRDIREGVDVEAVQKGDYSSASVAMREEYAALAKACKAYGFGRKVNLQPVKSTDQAIAKYLSKYVAKHIGKRELRDKGVRVVGYWGHASKGRSVRVGFQFQAVRSRLWRWQVGEFARRTRCADLDALKVKFGPRWCHSQHASILAIEPPAWSVGVKKDGNGQPQPVTMWDVWNGDRLATAERVAKESGQTQAAVFMALYQIDLAAGLDAMRYPELAAKRDPKEGGRYAAMVEASNRLESKRLASMNEDGEQVEVTRVMWCGPDLSDTVATRISL